MRKIVIVLILLSNVALAQKIRIATYQYADNPRIKNLEPLAQHLQAKLGIETEVKSYQTVQLFIEAIQKGEVDLAFINTFGYLLLKTGNKDYPMKPCLVMIAPDSVKANYKTAFIASASSPIKTWMDVKKYTAQTRLALVFSASTSGNLVPRLGLTKLGLNNAEQSFKRVTYCGTHSNALVHVLNDSSDLAAMGSAEFYKLTPQQQDRLRVIWLSPEIPLGPALINTKLNKSMQKLIRQELLELHKTDQQAFTSLKGAWSEAATAVNFISISKNYYKPFLKGFGKKDDIYPILQQFAR